MERTIHESVESFFHAIAPLLDQPHVRVDERATGLMGRFWEQLGVSHLIGISEFKTTGDIEKFQELYKERFGKKAKPRPEYEPPESESGAEEDAGDGDAPTVH